jgi:hypothetical protein
MIIFSFLKTCMTLLFLQYLCVFPDGMGGEVVVSRQGSLLPLERKESALLVLVSDAYCIAQSLLKFCELFPSTHIYDHHRLEEEQKYM